MGGEPLYRVTINLNVLNYCSNVPSAISEVVANSYDTYAKMARITLDKPAAKVIIMWSALLEGI